MSSFRRWVNGQGNDWKLAKPVNGFDSSVRCKATSVDHKKKRELLTFNQWIREECALAEDRLFEAHFGTLGPPLPPPPYLGLIPKQIGPFRRFPYQEPVYIYLRVEKAREKECVLRMLGTSTRDGTQLRRGGVWEIRRPKAPMQDNSHLQMCMLCFVKIFTVKCELRCPEDFVGKKSDDDTRAALAAHPLLEPSAKCIFPFY